MIRVPTTVMALALAAPVIAAEPAPSHEEQTRVEPRAQVGVLPLVVVGDATHEIGEARAAMLSERVHAAFSHADYDAMLLRADVVGDAEHPYCATPVCWKTFADEYDATHFLVVVVDYTEPDYRIDARLFDGRSGDLIGRREDTCDLCGVAELGERVQDVGAAMRRDVEATLVPPPILSITSVPVGAEIIVDGGEAGRTPLEVTVPAGRHEVEVVREGYFPETLQVDLIDGTVREMTVRLRKETPAVTDDEGARGGERPSLWFGLGGAAVALGGGAVVGGGLLISIHADPIEGDCSGDNVDALGRCRYLHDTRAAGIGLVVAGAAAIVGGAVMAVVGTKQRNASAREAKVRLRPHGLGIAGRF